MIKSTKHQILPEIKVTVEYFSGLINLDDLIKHRNILADDNEFNPVDILIADFRYAHLNLKKMDILAFIDFMRSTKKLLGDRRAAILTNTPNQVVASSIYISNLKDLPMKVNFFSTLNAAIGWVHLPINDMDLIDETLKKMKNESVQIKSESNYHK
jgi:hypothetical protein